MLNDGQKYGYNVMTLGYNTFLTGEAGTGKTYTLLYFINEQLKVGKNVLVTAPTGIAALNLNGATLNSALSLTPNSVYLSLLRGSINDLTIEKLKNTDVLILDEISICRIDLFDVTCRHILTANELRKRYDKSPIQVIVCGDFFQLPPVMTPKDKYYLDKHYGFDVGAGFAFQSIYWELLDFKYVVLNEIMRQNQSDFTSYLNKVRVGNKQAIDFISDNCCKTKISDAITIYGKNIDVYNKNIIELDKLPGDALNYEAEIDNDATEDDVIADKNLILKLNARVMSIINDNNLGIVNGLLGNVTSMDEDFITVKFDNGCIETIGRHTWDVYGYKVEETDSRMTRLERYVAGTFTQFPLKLAYAATIHKSQGQTYNCVNLSPYCWDCGQLYVAISRVKKLENMYLEYEIDPRYVVVSLNVIKFYNKINSEANKLEYAYTPYKQKEAKVDMDDDMSKLLDKLSKI